MLPIFRLKRILLSYQRRLLADTRKRYFIRISILVFDFLGTAGHRYGCPFFNVLPCRVRRPAHTAAAAHAARLAEGPRKHVQEQAVVDQARPARPLVLGRAISISISTYTVLRTLLVLLVAVAAVHQPLAPHPVVLSRKQQQPPAARLPSRHLAQLVIRRRHPRKRLRHNRTHQQPDRHQQPQQPQVRVANLIRLPGHRPAQRKQHNKHNNKHHNHPRRLH